jgi:purine-binding chemotaxis protein CheW
MATATATQYCTFFLDGLFFGVDVQRVQEVLRHQQMTPVPLAPESVQGLINLRGQIVTALDLRRRLGMPPRTSDKPPMNIVIRSAEEAVALLVDEIGEVVDVEDGRFERPPETLQGPARNLIPGAYKLDQRLLLILDVEKAVAADAD